MNVLVLVNLPVHMRVGVCVDVRVDFRVDFGWDAGSGLAEEELLLGQVLLIVHGAHAVFIWAGGAGGRSGAAPVPLSIRGSVGALQRLWGGSAGRGAVFSALAKPQQDGGKDEDYSGRDADDDGPGEGAGIGREQRDGGLCVCKEKRDTYGRAP